MGTNVLKWRSTPEKIAMKICDEFHCHQIAEKILSKIPAMHYEPRKINIHQFVVVLVRLRMSSAFV